MIFCILLYNNAVVCIFELAQMKIILGEDIVMTKRDLVNELSKKTGTTQREAAKMVEALCEVICDQLSSGEEVKLNGFGSFQIRHRAPRKGRNPVTGESMPVPATNVVAFKAGGRLAETVANMEIDG